MRNYKCFWVLLLFFAACSTGQKGDEVPTLEKISSDKEFPDELSTDIREKFKVGSVEQAQPQEGAAPAKKAAPKAPPKKAWTPPDRRTQYKPIWIDEEMTLEITYFGAPAGTFTVGAMGFKEINGRKTYHIKGVARTSDVFSVFYKVNDSIETFLDTEGLYSHRFQVILDESKQTRNSLELYDHEKKETYYWDRWNHWKKGFSEKKETKPMAPLSQDSLSALYYVRFLPLPNGASFEIPIVTEGNTWHAKVLVLRRETLDTPMGKMKAIVLQPKTYYQGVLKERGDSFIWLSDDDRRWLLRIEAKVKIGTVKAILKSIKPGLPPS